MNNSEFTYIYLSKITLYQPRLLHLTDHNHKDQAIEAGKPPKNGTPVRKPMRSVVRARPLVRGHAPPIQGIHGLFLQASSSLLHYPIPRRKHGGLGALLSAPQPQAWPNCLLLSPLTPQRRGIGFFPHAAAATAAGTVAATVWRKRTRARWGE